MKRLLFFLLVLAWGGTALGANCGGATPCACGDTVTSDYTFSSDLDCSGGGALTIGANNIDIDLGGYTLTCPNGATCIYALSRSGFTITNGAIAGDAGDGVIYSHDGADGNSFTNLIITGGSNQLYIRARNNSTSNGITISGNTFADGNTAIWLESGENGADVGETYDVTIDGNTLIGGTGAGIWIVSADTVPANAEFTSDVQITNNSITGRGGAGMIINGLNNDHGANLISNNTVSGNSSGGTTGGVHLSYASGTTVSKNTVSNNLTNGVDGCGIYTDNGSSGVVVERNVVSGHTTGTWAVRGASASAGLATTNCSGTIFRNNIVTGNVFGLNIGWNASGASAGIIAYNNTFTGNTHSDVYINANCDAAELTFVNNLVDYGANTGVDCDDQDGTFTSSYCLWNGAGTKFAAPGDGGDEPTHTDTSAVSDDPLLNATTYAPTAASPCIDAGADLSATFTTDYNGNTRPAGTAFDIGAYEFAAGGTVIGDGSTISNSVIQDQEVLIYGDYVYYCTFKDAPVCFAGNATVQNCIFDYQDGTAIGVLGTKTVTGGYNRISDASVGGAGTYNGEASDKYGTGRILASNFRPLDPWCWFNGSSIAGYETAINGLRWPKRVGAYAPNRLLFLED